MTYDPGWPLDEFPQPNPFFPAPPRTGRRALPLPKIGKKNHAALMGIVPVIGASGAFVSLVFFLKRIPWRHGRIVPARVIMPTFGGGVDGVGVALGVLGAVVPVGGAVASAFGGSEAPTRIQLEWVDGGLVHAGTPANAVDSEIDRADITVWLIIGREPRLLDAVAPREFASRVLRRGGGPI